MSRANWNLDEDRRTVTLTLPTNPPVSLKLDAVQVEDVLKKLGEFRALMHPPVDPKYARRQRVKAITRPGWATEPEAMRADSLLHVRDPRYGWLHYLLPKVEAAKLGAALSTQAEIRLIAPAKGKTN